MLNDFIYDIPVRIYFGRDQLKHRGTELKKYGTRVLMTYGGGTLPGFKPLQQADVEKIFEMSME